MTKETNNSLVLTTQEDKWTYQYDRMITQEDEWTILSNHIDMSISGNSLEFLDYCCESKESLRHCIECAITINCTVYKNQIT